MFLEDIMITISVFSGSVCVCVRERECGLIFSCTVQIHTLCNLRSRLPVVERLHLVCLSCLGSELVAF